MKRLTCGLILIAMLFLSACNVAVPEPPILPLPPTLPLPTAPSALRERHPLPELAPSPVFLIDRLYQPVQGTICLVTTESYHNVRHYFQVTVGDMFEDLLIGLGYRVDRTTQSNCELVVNLELAIELLPSTYFFQGLKPTCYSGIKIEGQIAVSVASSGLETTIPFGESQSIPIQIKANECYQLTDNPLVSRWQKGFIGGLVDIWGSGILALIVGAEWPPELESFQREAFNAFGPAEASSVGHEYVIYALANKYSYQLLKILEMSDVSVEHKYLIPIILENMAAETQTIEESKQSLMPLVEINLLKALQPDQEFANTALPAIILDLSVIYQKEDAFIASAIDILASVGPEVIPAMMAYLYDHPDDPQVVRAIVDLVGRTSKILVEAGHHVIPVLVSYVYHHQSEPIIANAAGGGLDHLIRNGYREQVAEQAGHYLCYLLFRMEKGEIPYDPTIRNLLRLIFPEQSDSSTKSGQYFKLWQANYGEE